MTKEGDFVEERLVIIKRMNMFFTHTMTYSILDVYFMDWKPVSVSVNDIIRLKELKAETVSLNDLLSVISKFKNDIKTMEYYISIVNTALEKNPIIVEYDDLNEKYSIYELETSTRRPTADAKWDKFYNDASDRYVLTTDPVKE